jgi:hypothetical protein
VLLAQDFNLLHLVVDAWVEDFALDVLQAFADGVELFCVPLYNSLILFFEVRSATRFHHGVVCLSLLGDQVSKLLLLKFDSCLFDAKEDVNHLVPCVLPVIVPCLDQRGA